MADDNTRGVQLNEKQLVFVLMAAGVICGVVFLFGVMVGRNVQLSRGASAEGTMISPPQVVSDPQPSADPLSAKPAGAAGDEYSYPKRLSQAEAPAERLKPAGPADSTGATPTSPPGGKPAAVPAPNQAGSGSAPPDMPDEASTVKPTTDGPAAASRFVDTPAAKPAGDAASGLFTVQIMAKKKRPEADAMAKKLHAKGYDVRVVVPEDGDRSGVFRVKVGSYKTRAEAEAVASRIKGDGPFPTWVTR